MNLPLAQKLILMSLVPEYKLYLGEAISNTFKAMIKGSKDVDKANKKNLTIAKVLPALEFHLSQLKKNGWKANSKSAKELSDALDRLRSFMLIRNMPISKSL